jgi:hypothetical protein
MDIEFANQAWKSLITHVFACGWGNNDKIVELLKLSGRSREELHHAVNELNKKFDKWCDDNAYENLLHE